MDTSRSFVEAVDFYFRLKQYNIEMETMINLSDYEIYKKFFLGIMVKLACSLYFSRKFAVFRLLCESEIIR